MTFSKKQYVERYRTDAFYADMPVDTGCSWNMLDNLAHMVDEAGGYIINYVNSAGAAAVAVSDGGGGYVSTLITVSRVVTTMSRSGLMPNYSVRLGARITGGGTANARISIVRAHVPPPVRGLTTAVYGTATGSTTSSTGAWCIEALFTNVDVGTIPIHHLQVPSYNDDYEQTTQRILVDVIAEVYGTGMISTGSAGIIGMQVREYPREV